MVERDNKDQMILQELVRRSNDEARRLRELEQRSQILEGKTSSLEGMLLEKMKRIDAKFAEIEVSIKNLSDDLLRIGNNLDKINKQLAHFAMRRDVKEIEKMFDLLSPAKQLSTKKEIQELRTD